MLLDKMIENKKELLNCTINSRGIMDKQTIKISEQLDRLIVKRMTLGYGKTRKLMEA